MDHVARRHGTGGGLDRLPEPDRCLLGRFPLYCGPAGPGDRRGDAATVAQLRVGRIGDGVEFEFGDVGLAHFSFDHRLIVDGSGAARGAHTVRIRARGPAMVVLVGPAGRLRWRNDRRRTRRWQHRRAPQEWGRRRGRRRGSRRSRRQRRRRWPRRRWRRRGSARRAVGPAPEARAVPAARPAPVEPPANPGSPGSPAENSRSSAVATARGGASATAVVDRMARESPPLGS